MPLISYLVEGSTRTQLQVDYESVFVFSLILYKIHTVNKSIIGLCYYGTSCELETLFRKIRNCLSFGSMNNIYILNLYQLYHENVPQISLLMKIILTKTNNSYCSMELLQIGCGNFAAKK